MQTDFTILVWIFSVAFRLSCPFQLNSLTAIRETVIFSFNLDIGLMLSDSYSYSNILFIYHPSVLQWAKSIFCVLTPKKNLIFRVSAVVIFCLQGIYCDVWISISPHSVLLERTEIFSHLGEGRDVNFLDQHFEVGEHFLSGQLCEKQKEMTLL